MAKKGTLTVDDMEGVDPKIQFLDVENMAQNELDNVCEGIVNITSKYYDDRTSSEAKPFIMHFNVSKYREDVGLLQSGIDSGSKFDNQHKYRMVMV